MKKFKLLFVFALVFVLTLTGCSSSSDAPEEEKYQFITAEQLKADIESNKEMIMVDIQPKEDFDAHHIKGVIPTYAYPAETAEERALLDDFAKEFKDGDLPIIIVCPGGGGGAKNTWDYLEEKGLDTSRFLILENGQKGWPYEELLEK